jgi:hypothetical protein
MRWTRTEIDECEKRLAAIAAALEQRDSVTLDEARALLRNANGRWLLSFDAASRSRSLWGHAGGSTRRLTDWWSRQPDRERTESLLFVQACISSGFMRERALHSPRWTGDRLTCAATLIRLEDWVPEVTEAARKMFVRLATTASIRHVFGLLDLVAALRTRARFSTHWQLLVEPILLAAQWRAERHRAMSAPDASARKLAYELCFVADVDAAPTVLRRALADPALRIALWAIEQISRQADPQAQREMLRAALDHGHGVVRAGALRQLARLEVEDLRQLLRDRLLDRARAVRGVAAYQLQARFGESALIHWRAAFDAGHERAMLTGVLAEACEVEDQPRLRSQLGHPNSRVRAAALLGLCRTDAEEREDLVRRCLHDRSARVVRAAIDGIVLCKMNLGAEELTSALSSAGNALTRARLIAATRLLSKWDRLEHALMLYQRCHPEEWHLLDALLRAWEAGFNRSYVNIDAARRQALLERLEGVSRLHPRLRIGNLTALVR